MSKQRKVRPAARRLPAAFMAIAGAIWCFGPSRAHAQSDDFNDGADADWTHYDPLGSPPVNGPPASYTFPTVAYAGYGASNRAYELSDPSTTEAGNYGPSRAGSVREDAVYSTTFYAAVDLVSWETTHDEALGLLARTTSPGLGTTDGYALTYSVGSTEIDISRADDESATNLGLTKLSEPLVPGHGYRLVFTGAGSLLTGQIFDDANLAAPLATVTATDATYASGYSGLIVFDNTEAPASNGADATFDNYVADAVPEPTAIAAVILAGAGLLRRRRGRTGKH